MSINWSSVLPLRSQIRSTSDRIPEAMSKPRVLSRVQQDRRAKQENGHGKVSASILYTYLYLLDCKVEKSYCATRAQGPR